MGISSLAKVMILLYGTPKMALMAIVFFMGGRL